jgi:polysaccharide deacetylase 2 family uncharacterized protein YibQ
MFERFAKRYLGARKRGRGKGRGTKSRRAKTGRAKTASGFLTGLARRPALLVACGAGIGLIIGALVATHRGSAPAVSAKPAVGSEVAAVMAPPQPAKVAPAEAPTPAPSAGTPATPPPANAGRPAWQQYAKAVPQTEGRPMIAIVIDDMGIDKADSARVIDLPPAITIAFMTYAKDLARQAAAARAAGHEIWLHVPMEPLDGELDAGPHALKTSLTPAENRQRLDWALAQLDGYVGINNHMGSRFTSSEAEMKPVLAEVKARGLAFLDSRTTAATVAGRMASEMGVPHIDRDVFIDNDETVEAVLVQLRRTEEIALKRGRALAIGHPHATTIAALLRWLPTLKEKGFVLVPASALLHQEPATAG